MDYSPKLKMAAEEIKAIIKKYNIGASIVLHTPGHAEYVNALAPSYSCATVNGDSIRFKASKADFDGDVKAMEKKVADTANMLRLLSEVVSKNAMMLIEMSEKFDKVSGADHGDTNHSSHTTQNN